MGICEIRFFPFHQIFQIETFNTGGFHHSIDKNNRSDTLRLEIRSGH